MHEVELAAVQVTGEVTGELTGDFAGEVGAESVLESYEAGAQPESTVDRALHAEPVNEAETPIARMSKDWHK